MYLGRIFLRAAILGLGSIAVGGVLLVLNSLGVHLAVSAFLIVLILIIISTAELKGKLEFMSGMALPSALIWISAFVFVIAKNYNVDEFVLAYILIPVIVLAVLNAVRVIYLKR